jgi:predicted N-acetyltransferase YhbS
VTTIRAARPADREAVLAVHRAAFGSEIEPQLVADLLDASDAHPVVSVLAEDGPGSVVAHVLLTAGSAPGHAEIGVQILAPLAVVPDRQRQGLGDAVTRHALTTAEHQGVRCVCVLGHPTYYPRFGFAPLLPHGPLPVVDPAPEHADAWMTLYLGHQQDETASALDGVRISWAEPLMEPQLWAPD